MKIYKKKFKICWSAFLVLLCGCAINADDFWGIQYRTAEQGIAVLNLVIRGERGIIYRQYSVQPGGALTRYRSEAYAGAMPRPKSLYVQWIDENTGAIHDQQMDLQGRLPSSLDDDNLILIFDKNEVYLFAEHIASSTAGHPLNKVPAQQVFPDPALKPFTGTGRPESAYY